MSELDHEFLARALRVTSFNLNANDFISLRHKKEIQHLFTLNMFPKFDHFLDTVNKAQLNRAISELRRTEPTNFQHLYSYNIKGVGPGEIMLYYLLNKGHLGGGSSAGLDLVVGSKGYEIKAVDYSPQGYVNNFKVGGTFSLANIIRETQDLKRAAGLGSGSEVNSGELKVLEEKYPKEIKKIYNDYADITYKNYFRSHDIIFLANSNGRTYKKGDVIDIRKVKKEEILFERITSGTIKPRVLVR